jgi:hypothetical protein
VVRVQSAARLTFDIEIGVSWLRAICRRCRCVFLVVEANELAEKAELEAGSSFGNPT